MGKPKLHPVTQVLNLLDALSDDEKRIIYDCVRPAPKPRQKGKPERKMRARRTSTVNKYDICGKPGCIYLLDDNVHQLRTSLGYHEFVKPAGEASKGAGA